jgi:hypothetical protein
MIQLQEREVTSSDREILLSWQIAKFTYDMQELCHLATTPGQMDEYISALNALLDVESPELKRLAIEANLSAGDADWPEFHKIADRRRKAQVALYDRSFEILDLYPNISRRVH